MVQRGLDVEGHQRPVGVEGVEGAAELVLQATQLVGQVVPGRPGEAIDQLDVEEPHPPLVEQPPHAPEHLELVALDVDLDQSDLDQVGQLVVEGHDVDLVHPRHTRRGTAVGVAEAAHAAVLRPHAQRARAAAPAPTATGRTFTSAVSLPEFRLR